MKKDNIALFVELTLYTKEKESSRERMSQNRILLYSENK